MKSILVSALLLLIPKLLLAQTTSNFSDFTTWISSQQAHAGLSLDLHRTKYATTWWDLISIGQAGLNVALPQALDYVDLGPAVSAANGAPTRYGVAVPVHLGNIWNSLSSHLPAKVASHLNLTTLPNVVAGGGFMFPQNGQLDKWTWSKDFQATLGYKFGGPN